MTNQYLEIRVLEIPLQNH